MITYLIEILIQVQKLTFDIGCIFSSHTTGKKLTTDRRVFRTTNGRVQLQQPLVWLSADVAVPVCGMCPAVTIIKKSQRQQNAFGQRVRLGSNEHLTSFFFFLHRSIGSK
jgi:hypothetical protein